jgi:hypothetical protein
MVARGRHGLGEAERVRGGLRPAALRSGPGIAPGAKFQQAAFSVITKPRLSEFAMITPNPYHLFNSSLRGSSWVCAQSGFALITALAVWIPRPAAAVSPTPSFGPQTTIEVGIDSFSIAAADFNGDSAPDLAVPSQGDLSHQGDRAAWVLLNLNDGSGGFDQPTTFDIGTDALSIAVGDFNGDHASELTTANFGSHTVSVRLNVNDGSGGFSAESTFPAGTGPSSVAVGDFNGDGSPDLAIANFGGTVTVLLNLNDGSGGFGAPVPFSVGSGPVFVAIDDFNGDGAPDLAVANTFGDTVSVLLNLNNGSGGFGPETTFDVGSGPSSVAAADFDGDGWSDLAVTNRTDDTVLVLLNLGNGSGGFGTATTFEVGSSPSSVAVGDFDGDGWSDLAVTNRADDTISVLLNRGDGSVGFGAQTSFDVEIEPTGVAVADFNGDGAPDLAVANFGADTVSVLLNQLVDPMVSIPLLQGSVDELVSGGAMLPANGKSLEAKLDAALAALPEDPAAAISALQSFINQVKSFIKAGRISEMDGQALIDAASAIIDRLSS